MALFPAPVVEAPELLRRRYGLFDAAIGPLDLPEPHGQGAGVRYISNGCGAARVLGVDCYEPGDAPTKLFDADDEEIDTGVFVAVASLTCNAVGYTQQQLDTKVLRRLENGEQAAVEMALWSGLDFEGNDLGIRSLDEVAVPVPAGYEGGLITEVVAALERYAYFEQQYGGPAFLHAPVEVGALAAEAGLVHWESIGNPNSRKVTPSGSIWVFGAYPAGEVIVTGQTTVWRAQAAELATSFERTDNTKVLLAERAYAVGFDCFAGRASYDPLEVTSP